MYFNKFPNLNHGGDLIVDISRRYVIPENMKSQIGFFTMYEVKEGEKIEDVSYIQYGNPEYHWVIMLMNDIIDPYFDWVLSNEELNLFILDNYPGTGNNVNAPDGIHHYLLNGNIINHNAVGSVSISNRTYETDQNEMKRKIKLLRPEYISQVEQEMSSLLLS